MYIQETYCELYLFRRDYPNNQLETLVHVEFQQASKFDFIFTIKFDYGIN